MKIIVILLLLGSLTHNKIIIAEVSELRRLLNPALTMKEQIKQKKNNKKPSQVYGFEYDSGEVVPIICISAIYGNLPGKLTKLKATFTSNGDQLVCKNYKKITGDLRPASLGVAGCKSTGSEGGIGRFWNALIINKNGVSPGDFHENFKVARFGNKKRVITVTDLSKIYIICPK